MDTLTGMREIRNALTQATQQALGSPHQASPAQAGQPAVESNVKVMLMKHSELISRLTSRVETLAGRLKSVLLIVPSNTNQTVAAPPSPPMCDLASEIRHLNESLERVDMLMSEMIKSLDV